MKPFVRNLAVIIGINKYENEKLENLQTAKDDAKRLASILERTHAYEPIIRMTDDDNEPPTRKNLLYLLENKLPKEINLTEKDRLVFYFAGHGTKRDSNTEPAGYLVPKDGDIDDISTLLDMKTLIQRLTNLPCRHLLLIFDCCFGGAIRWEIFRKGTTAPQNFYQEHYQQYTQAKAWQVITSSTYKEEALDSFRDTRGQLPGTNHSPFAHFLFKALEDGEADRFGTYKNGIVTGDGVITATELYLYLRDQVQISSKLSQTPQLFPLKNHESGEYIFELPDFDFDNLKKAPELDPKNNPYRGLNPFDEEDAQFFFGREELKDELCKKVSSSPSNLTIVLGASGSGKSSLVKAGLIPCLREQTQQKWCILNPMRPGEAPFNELAITIASLIDVIFSTQELKKLSFLSQYLQNKKAELQIHKDSKIKRLREKYKSFLKISEVWDSDDNQAKSKVLLENYQELYHFLSEQNANQQAQSFEQKILRDIVYHRLTELHNNLKANPQYFIDTIKKWSQQHPQEHLLLLIDQFEELITLNQNQQGKQKKKRQHGVGNEQEGFLNLLKKTLEANLSQLHIVLTLRSDFEPRFVTTDVFASHWKNARFQVRAMRTEELRQAIEQPATEMALEFDPQQPGLVDNLIDEVSQMPGALPLLSFTLSELYINLYERNKGKSTSDRILKLEDKFAQQGGVIGSLTRKANEIYDQLDDKVHKATMRRVMLRMVTIEGGESARRRVPRSELIYSDVEENNRVEKVIDTLSEARLIVHGTNSEGKPCVEPAHDALVKGWDQLQKWKEEDEEGLFLQQRLIPASNDWYDIAKEEKTQNKKKLFQLPEALWKLPVHFYASTEALAIDKYQTFQHQKQRKKIQKSKKSQANGNTKSKAYLWNNDPRLEQLNQVIDSENDWLNQIEDDFVKQSSIEKGRKNFRWTIGYSVAALVLLSLTGLASWGYIESLKGQIRANRESAEANLRSGNGSGNGIEAMLDILRARNTLKKWPLEYGYFKPDIQTAEVQGTLHNVLYGVRELNRIQVNRGRVRDVALSPDGKLLATIGEEDRIFLWDVSAGKATQLTQFSTQQNNVYSVTVFNLNNIKLLATSGSDGTVKLWEIEQKGDKVTDTKQLIQTKQKKVYIAFNSKDKLLATGGKEDNKDISTVKFWKIEEKDGNVNFTEDSKRSIGKKQETIYSLAFASNGLLAIVGKADNVSLWDTSSAALLKEFSTKQTDVYSVAFNPNGNLLVTGGKDGTVKQWKIEQEGKGKYKDPQQIQKPIQTKQKIVYSLALASNGKLATLGADDGVILWDRNSGKSIDSIRPLEKNVRIKVVALTDTRLATGGEDGTVRIWDKSGKLLSRFPTDKSELRSISVSPDGKLIATIGEDNQVRLWNVSSPSSLHKPLEELADKKFLSVAFNAQGDHLAAASEDGTVKLWKIEQKDGEEVNLIEAMQQPIQTNQGGIYGIAFNNDGKLATLGTKEKKHTLFLWNTSGEQISNIRELSLGSNLKSVAFTPDGKLAIGDAFSVVKLWDISQPDKPKQFDILQTQQGIVNDLAFSPDGKLATVGEDGTIKLWNIETQQPIQSPPNVTKLLSNIKISNLVFFPEEDNQHKNQLAIVGNDGTIKLLEINNKDYNYQIIPRSFNKELEDVISKQQSLVISPNGKVLAILDKDKPVKLWDISTGNFIDQIPGEQNINMLVFSPDGNLLATLGKDKKVKLWDFSKKEIKFINEELINENIDINLVFSPDSKLLAIATRGENSKVLLWDLSEKLKSRDPILTEQKNITSIAFSFDSKLIATGGEDGTVRLGNTSGTLHHQINTLQEKLKSLVFSPDGKLIATIGEKNTLKMWYTLGDKIRPMKAQQNEISSVAFSTDGKLLATSGEKGEIKLWQLGGSNEINEEIVAQICYLVNDYLNSSSDVEESDKKLCDGLKEQVEKIKSVNERRLQEQQSSNVEIPAEPMTPLQAIAEDFYNRGQEQVSENLIRKKPNNVDDYINRGIAYYRLRNKYQDKNYIKLSIEHYTTALKMSPTTSQSVQAYVNRGIAYSTRSNPGDQELAIADYNEVINNLNPNYVDAYISRGIAYSALKEPQHQQAIDDYNKAISIQPNNANAHYALGFTLALLQGKEQEAIAAYKAAASLYQKQGKENYRRSADQRIQELNR